MHCVNMRHKKVQNFVVILSASELLSKQYIILFIFITNALKINELYPPKYILHNQTF